MNQKSQSNFKPFVNQLDRVKVIGPKFTFSTAINVLNTFDNELLGDSQNNDNLNVHTQYRQLNVNGLAGFFKFKVGELDYQLVAAPQVAVFYKGFFLTRVWLTELSQSKLPGGIIEKWKEIGFLSKPACRQFVTPTGKDAMDIVSREPFHQLINPNYKVNPT